jgi:hypothetical protein
MTVETPCALGQELPKKIILEKMLLTCCKPILSMILQHLDASTLVDVSRVNQKIKLHLQMYFVFITTYLQTTMENYYLKFIHRQPINDFTLLFSQRAFTPLGQKEINALHWWTNYFGYHKANQWLWDQALYATITFIKRWKHFDCQQVNKIALLSERPTNWQNDLKIGDYVEASCGRSEYWYISIIKDRKKDQFLIHFIGWEVHHDTWVSKDWLSPIGTRVLARAPTGVNAGKEDYPSLLRSRKKLKT